MPALPIATTAFANTLAPKVIVALRALADRPLQKATIAVVDVALEQELFFVFSLREFSRIHGFVCSRPSVTLSSFGRPAVLNTPHMSASHLESDQFDPRRYGHPWFRFSVWTDALLMLDLDDRIAIEYLPWLVAPMTCRRVKRHKVVVFGVCF